MRAFVGVGLLLAATVAHAYVGPGLGLGVIGAFLGGLAAFFLAIVGLVWYPLKRLFRKSRSRGAEGIIVDEPISDGERLRREKVQKPDA